MALESATKNKFRGCLLGSLIGDCLGSKFEGIRFFPGERALLDLVTSHIDKAESNQDLNLCYTDDTQMTQELAKSLLHREELHVDNNELDYGDLSRKFAERFYFDGARAGYGANVIDVFRKLRDSDYKDPLGPAREQFNGSGSYGNGAAMRVAPAALFAYSDLAATANLADQSSLPTHTHQLGRHGAIFQALAIRACLQATNITNANDFLHNLKSDLKKVDICDPYLTSISDVKTLLHMKDNVDKTVVERLGNGVAAVRSVPTALFAFLWALKPISGLKTNNGFRRTVEYAISLGGDTDTIASMAGALAGAYYGQSGINGNIVAACADYDLAITQADAFYNRLSGLPEWPC